MKFFVWNILRDYLENLHVVEQIILKLSVMLACMTEMRNAYKVFH